MTRKHEVDAINRKQLSELRGEGVVMQAKDVGSTYAMEQLKVSQHTRSAFIHAYQGMYVCALAARRMSTYNHHVLFLELMSRA